MDVELVTASQDVDAEPYRAHLVATFRDLKRRLGPPHDDRPARFYLFRTAWEYKDLLRSHGLDATGSGGAFFLTEDVEGLATFTRGLGRNRVLANLQHEAFHCFAHRTFKTTLPLWLNEGLAQYFEDALVLDGRLRLSSYDTRRLQLLQRTAEKVPLPDLLDMDEASWSAMMKFDPNLSGVMYAAAWGLVRFLVTADTPWRKPFIETLHRLRRGDDADDAVVWLREASTLDALRSAWLQWISEVEPDPLSVAMDRLITMGELLSWLHANNQRMPTTIDEFRSRMRLMGMELTLHSRGGVFLERMRGDDARLFNDPGADESTPLQLTPGPTPRFPPTLCAAATTRQPTLQWCADQPRELDWRIDLDGSC